MAGLFGGAFSLGAAALSAKATKKLVREQMEFQERMFKNQTQYRVQDLRAAGINPILASQFGGSTPPGASAQINYDGSGAVQAASSATRVAAEKKLMKQQGHLTDVKRNTEATQQMLNIESTRKAKADADLANSAADVNRVNATIAQLRIPGLINEMNVDLSTLGKIMANIRRVTSGAGALLGGGSPRTSAK